MIIIIIITVNIIIVIIIIIISVNIVVTTTTMTTIKQNNSVTYCNLVTLEVTVHNTIAYIQVIKKYTLLQK
jgi:hypothetical protein